jgi:hypothetical protein
MRMFCIFIMAGMTHRPFFANARGANHCRFELMVIAPMRAQGEAAARGP